MSASFQNKFRVAEVIEEKNFLKPLKQHHILKSC